MLPLLYVTPYNEVSKLPAAFIFHPEDGSSVFLQNAAEFLSDYTVLHQRAQ
jgi:hypothetical protein